MKIALVPSSLMPPSSAPNGPLPPAEPVDTSVVLPPVRSYTSNVLSVSLPTIAPRVMKKTCEPSVEAAAKKASKAPLAPAPGPVETSVVAPPSRM